MHSPYHRAKQGNALMLTLLIYNIVVTFAVSFLYWQAQGTPYASFFMSPWFSILSQIISFVVPVLLFLSLTRQTHEFSLILKPRQKLGRINIILILALCLCLQPAMMFFSALSALFFPNPVAELVSTLEPYPIALNLVAIAVVPAFCEEFVFRGCILAQYERVDIKIAAFINGLFFGLMHLNAQQFLYAFFMGVIFVFFVYYTRSLWSSILAHFTVNATQLLLGFWLENAPTEPTGATGTAAAQEAWQAALYMLVIAIIFLPAVFILFRSFVTHNRQRNTKLDIQDAMLEDDPDDESALIKDEKPFGLLFWCVLVVYGLFVALLTLA